MGGNIRAVIFLISALCACSGSGPATNKSTLDTSVPGLVAAFDSIPAQRIKVQSCGTTSGDMTSNVSFRLELDAACGTTGADTIEITYLDCGHPGQHSVQASPALCVNDAGTAMLPCDWSIVTATYKGVFGNGAVRFDDCGIKGTADILFDLGSEKLRLVVEFECKLCSIA